MERELPQYIGTPRDLAERVIFEFKPALMQNVRERKMDEVSGIIKLQKQMTEEILK